MKKYLAIAAIPIVMCVAIILGRGEHWANTLVLDDAYYYYETAQNIAGGHGSTFDRLSETNGYHPLWMAICVVVAMLPLGKASYLLAMLVVCVGLYVGTTLLLLRLDIGHQLIRSSGGVCLCALFFAFNPNTMILAMSGMEWILAFFCLVLQLTALKSYAMPPAQTTSKQMSKAALVGFTGGLMALSRIDLAPLAIALTACLCIRQWRYGFNGKAALAVGLATFCAVFGPYVAMNYAKYGHVGTVSSYIKTNSLRMTALDARDVAVLDAAYRFSDSASYAIAPCPREVIAFAYSTTGVPVGRLVRPLILAPMAVLFVLGVAYVATSHYWAKWPLLILLAWSVVHSAAICMLTPSYAAYAQWYMVAQAFVVGAFVGIAGQQIFSLAVGRAIRNAIIAACAVCAIGAVSFNSYTTRAAKHAERMQLVDMIRDVVPAEARIGCWSSGQIGYWIDNPVVPMDGLINSFDYAENYMGDGPAGVLRYLVVNDVRYVAGRMSLDEWEKRDTVFRLPTVPRDVRMLATGTQDDSRMAVARIY